MIALMEDRLVHPVRVFLSDNAVHGDPWEFFLALDPCPTEQDICELIGWTKDLGRNGPFGFEPARACHKLMIEKGYKVMKSTHYVDGKPRVKFLELEKVKI